MFSFYYIQYMDIFPSKRQAMKMEKLKFFENTNDLGTKLFRLNVLAKKMNPKNVRNFI